MPTSETDTKQTVLPINSPQKTDKKQGATLSEKTETTGKTTNDVKATMVNKTVDPDMPSQNQITETQVPYQAKVRSRRVLMATPTQNQDVINWEAVQYQKQADGNVDITGWDIDKGGLDILLPNTYDFTQKGIIAVGKQAQITANKMHVIALASNNKANEQNKTFNIKISENGNGKLVAKDANWSGSFMGDPVDPMIGFRDGLEALRIAELNNLDTHNITDMSVMFQADSNLEKLKISDWNTSNVTDMSYMFDESNLQSLNVSNWDTSHVINMREMFGMISNLQSLDLSNWNTSNVTDMTKMFNKTGSKDGLVITANNYRGKQVPGSIGSNPIAIISNDKETFTDVSAWGNRPKTLKVTLHDNATNTDTVENVDLDKIAYDSPEALRKAIADNLAILKASKTDTTHAASDPVLTSSPANLAQELNANYKMDIDPKRTVQIRLIDDDNNSTIIGNPIQVTGIIGKSVDMPDIPAGYEFAPGQATTLTIPAENDLDVHLKHKRMYFTPIPVGGHAPFQVNADGDTEAAHNIYDLNKATSSDMPDNPNMPEYNFGTLVYNGHVNITDTDPITGEQTHAYTGFTAIRGVEVDEITGECKYFLPDISKFNETDEYWGKFYNGWLARQDISDNFFSLPKEYPGYSYSTKEEFDAALQNYNNVMEPHGFTNTGTEWAVVDNESLNIDHEPLSQTINIKYVDVDNNNQEVNAQPITGVTDGEMTIDYVAPDGYKLVEGQDLPTSHKFTPGDSLSIVVKVKHGTTHVDHDHPVDEGTLILGTEDKHYPAGLAHDDLNKTVTRQVTITDPTGKKTASTQTITFTRGATVDNVTDKVTYDPWSENGSHTFDKVDAPEVPGYTVTDEVPSVMVTPDTKSSTVNITYTANNQNITVSFVDDDDHDKLVGEPIVITGKTGETVNIPSIPENYRLADGENDKITVTSNPSQSVTIKLNHQIEERTVNKDLTYPIYGQLLLPEWNEGDYYKGFISSSKDATLKTFMIASKTFNLPVRQKIDKVTGKVIDASILNDNDLELGKINIPLDIGSWEVFTSFNGSPYNYYFGADLDPQYQASVNPPIDQNITVKELLAKYGYDSVYAIVEDLSGMTDKLHGILDPDSPQVKGAPAITGFDNPILGTRSEDTWDEPEIIVHYVSYKHEKKTITREITIVNPNGSKNSILQDTQISRVAFNKELEDSMGTINTDWSISKLPEYIVPQIPGYKASLDKVDALSVDQDTQDSKVVITYTALDGTQTIVYHDAKDGDVGKQTVLGKTDQMVDVTPEMPDGYVVKGEIPNAVIIKAKDTPIIVEVEHGSVTVDPAKPVSPGDKIPGTKDKHFGDDISDKHLNSESHRTITFHWPIGLKPANLTDYVTVDANTSNLVQTVKFHRTATVDMVTGKVTSYGKWIAEGDGNFGKVVIPRIAGYTAKIGYQAVPSLNSHASFRKMFISFFIAPPVPGKDILLDAKTGKVKKTDNGTNIDVKTGSAKGDVSSTVPIKDQDTSSAVEVEHDTTNIDPDTQLAVEDLISGTENKHYPVGFTHDDRGKPVTRTVNATDSHTQKIATTAQEATFKRSKVVDETPLEVTYDNESEDSKHEFTKIDVSKVISPESELTSTLASKESVKPETPVVDNNGNQDNKDIKVIAKVNPDATNLPQTGQKKDNLSIFGLLTISLASLLGIGMKKKKEE